MGAQRNRNKLPGVDGEPWVRSVDPNGSYACRSGCGKILPVREVACYTCSTGKPRLLLRPEERALAEVAIA